MGILAGRKLDDMQQERRKPGQHTNKQSTLYGIYLYLQIKMHTFACMFVRCWKGQFVAGAAAFAVVSALISAIHVWSV